MNTSEKKKVNLSDEELVSLVKTDGIEYLDILRKRYSPVIKRIAESFTDNVRSINDLLDAGETALVNAVMSYSQDNKASFKTFAYACIRNAVFAKIRDESNSKKRIPPSKIYSIEGIEAVDRNDPETLIIQRENLNFVLDAIKSKLTPMEYRVFYEYISGKSYKEIAEDTGKSLKSVSGAISRAKAKIKR